MKATFRRQKPSRRKHQACLPRIGSFLGVQLLALLLRMHTACACTSGCAAGPATSDGRPILWYNNDQSSAYLTPRINKYSGSFYDYIVLQTQSWKQGALNSNGLAKSGNNQLSLGSFGNTVGSRITQSADVAAVRDGLNTWAYSDATFAAVIDRHGNGCGFEIGTSYWEYNTTNASRQTQPEGYFSGNKTFVVRANAAFTNRVHREPPATVNSWSSSSSRSRYTSARDLFIQGIDDADKLTVEEVMAISRNGNPGMGGITTVCRSATAFGEIVLGVKSGDDPRFATMLAALGIPDYSIFIPVWCELSASELSGYVDAYDDTSIGYYAFKIYNDHFDNTSDYDNYIHSVFAPVEDNIIEAVKAARTNWLVTGNTSRFHTEAATLHSYSAKAAYHTMKSTHASAGAGGRACNLPPSVTSLGASVDGLTVHFNCDAADASGISYYRWRFGDGSTTNATGADLHEISHTYAYGGTYLVMCYVKDNHAVPAANARWEYVTVPGLAPPAAPSNPSATALSSSAIRVSWQDNSANETVFKIDRRQSGTTAWIRIATPGPDTSTHTDSGLTAETKYYYKVKAYNAAGNSAYSELAWATTPRAVTTALVVGKGTSWRYRRGTAPASVPANAWRGVAFDDSAWPSGAAPVGYSNYGVPIGTELTDMQNAYTCIFLRHAFVLANDAARVSELHMDADYDDGFVLWLNGTEIARVNLDGQPGAPLPHDATAVENRNANWTAAWTGGDLPALQRTNVLAVQLFNRSVTSGDCLFDAELSCVTELLAPGQDADLNHLPDDWETAHFDNTGQQTGADPDGDGLSNLEEWIAGSDPVSGSSTFDLAVALSDGGLAVSFSAKDASAAGYDGYTRRYSLETTRLDADAAWQAVPGYANIVGAGQTVTYTNPAPANPAGYRARVWLERTP